jgi:imidazolonepropionase-like amidohydrolase
MTKFASDPGLKIRVIFLLVGLCLGTGIIHARASDLGLRIEHVAVVSPDRSRALENATVVILNGRVARLTSRSSATSRSRSAMDTIDGRGLYLVPGLIDAHVHLGSIPGMNEEQEQAYPEISQAARVQIPRSYLYHGFTTLIDLDSTPERIARWQRQPLKPDTYFCGAAAVMDGYPMNWKPPPERYKDYPYLVVQEGQHASVQGINAAAHSPGVVVARMKADGARCVKTFFQRLEGQDLPQPSLTTLRALVRAGRMAHLPVLIHATGAEGHTLGLDAGVDVIAHGLWDWTGTNSTTELPPELRAILDREIATRVGIEPTMSVAYAFRDLFEPAYLSSEQLRHVLPAALIAWYGTPEGHWFRDRTATWLLPKSLAQSTEIKQWDYVRSYYEQTIQKGETTIRYLAARNARLIFGTDTPAVPSYANAPGLNGWLEMQRLVKAGVSPEQIFRAATLAPAEAFGMPEVGTVQVGARANLLLLAADPRQSTDAYSRIVKVILNGRALDPKDLAADSVPFRNTQGKFTAANPPSPSG